MKVIFLECTETIYILCILCVGFGPYNSFDSLRQQVKADPTKKSKFCRSTPNVHITNVNLSVVF